MEGPSGHLPHVVILGGGFGGLAAARRLRNTRTRVTLIDRRNHHLFQPLLYQVATAALNPSDIAAPIRRILRSRNVAVSMAEVASIDLAGKSVVLGDGERVAFDTLVVATGATHSYFGHDEWAAHAPGLKSVEDALEIRRRVLFAYEAAERELDPVRRRPWLTFVVVGGGPTGVELAGALAEISRLSLTRDYRNFDTAQARIVLIEGLPRVLGTLPERLSAKAQRSLERLGVEVRTSTMVTAVDGDGVLAGGERLSARTVLWAAGVAASPLARSLGVPLDRSGRVRVEPTLALPGRSDVFVIGDLAYLEQDGVQVPGVAPAAMQAGRHVAKNILRAARGEPLRPFRYWNRGLFAVIGRGSAVGVAFQRVEMSGVGAWLAWLGIHLVFLIGFRNRLMVLFNWAWSFFTLQSNAQLITGEEARDLLPATRARAPAGETRADPEPPAG